jgi:hypothetical protein
MKRRIVVLSFGCAVLFALGYAALSTLWSPGESPVLSSERKTSKQPALAQAPSGSDPAAVPLNQPRPVQASDRTAVAATDAVKSAAQNNTAPQKTPRSETLSSPPLELLPTEETEWVAFSGKGGRALVRPVVEEQPYGLRVTFTLTGLKKITREEEGETYVQLLVPGMSELQDIGKPALPFDKALIPIPDGVEPVVEVAAVSERTAVLPNPWPAQPPLADVRPDPPPAPFAKNAALYASDDWFPKETLLDSRVASIRGRRILIVDVAPVRVRPASGEARVADRIELDVRFEAPADDGSSGSDSGASKDEPLAETGFDSPTLPVYTILMDDQFADNGVVADLIDWKMRKGYDVRTILTSDIDAGGAPTHNQVRDYLRALDAGDYPEYLMIIGDNTAGNGVEGYYFLTSEGGWSDLYLSCRDAADDLPDLYSARVPAPDTATLSNMLSRMVDMDRSPPTNDYYQTVCVAGMIQDGEDSYANRADRLFCETADTIACFFEQDAGGVDYTCERALVNPNGVNSTCQWNHGSIVWNDGDEIGTRVYNDFVSATTARNRIIDNINRGVMIVQHRDHGYSNGSGWADPYFVTSHVDALTNGVKKCAVFSVNCASGAYHFDRFLRAWLQNPNGGAYAVYAPVDISYSWHNDWLTHGFYTAFLTNYVSWQNASSSPNWPRNLPAPGGVYGDAGSAKRVGEILNFGKFYYLEHYGWSSHSTMKNFHAFGDPEAFLYLPELSTQAVSHATVLDVYTSTITVTAEQDAVVCLYSDPIQVHCATSVPAAGTVSFDVTLINTGTVHVTATKYGCRPYEASMTITGDAPAYVESASEDVTDTGDGDGYLEPGETADLDIVLHNIGAGAATNVYLTLTNISSYIAVSNAYQSYGNVSGGERATNATPFALTVDSGCPAGEQQMQALVTADNGTWTNTFNITVSTVPTIVVTPQIADLAAVTGATDSVSVTVSNSGSGDLDLSVVNDLTDPFTYTVLDSNDAGGPSYNWTDISTNGTAVLLSDDGETGLMNLGFTFTLYGQPHTQFMIGANGVIGFESAGVSYGNGSLPSSAIPGPSVAPFWDDLNPSAGGNIYYHTDGSRLVVSWHAVPRYGESAGMTLQAILYDSGRILFQYHGMSGTLTSATIGMQQTATGDYYQVAYNESYVANGLAVSLAPLSGWLVNRPESVTVPPGGITSVWFDADATGVGAGFYRGTSTFSHNDPLAGGIDIPATFLVSDSSLPSPWVHSDVGGVGAAGTATCTGEVFNILGSGWDIEVSGDQDEFHYVYRTLSGNGQVVTKVLSQQATDPWAKTGLMMRESTNKASRHAMIVVTPGGSWQFMARSATGGGRYETNGGGVSLPYWVKLLRTNDTVRGYTSTNGSAWVERASQTFTNLSTTLMIGMPVCSHVDGTLGTAELSGSTVGDTDLDHDWMPDWWEEDCFGGSTNGQASADDDGDGSSNLDEWIAGCDPNSATSRFVAAAQTPSPAGNVITWPCATGRTYNLYWCTNLVDGFLPLATNLPAVLPHNSYTDTLHATDALIYYRVNVRK